MDADTGSDQLPPATLGGRRRGEARVPRQRHGQHATVPQFDHQRVACDLRAHRHGFSGHSRSAHAMPSRCRTRARARARSPWPVQPARTRGCTRASREPPRTSRPSDPVRRAHEPAPHDHWRRRTGGTDRSAGPSGSLGDCRSFASAAHLVPANVLSSAASRALDAAQCRVLRPPLVGCSGWLDSPAYDAGYRHNVRVRRSYSERSDKRGIQLRHMPFDATNTGCPPDKSAVQSIPTSAQSRCNSTTVRFQNSSASSTA